MAKKSINQILAESKSQIQNDLASGKFAHEQALYESKKVDEEYNKQASDIASEDRKSRLSEGLKRLKNFGKYNLSGISKQVIDLADSALPVYGDNEQKPDSNVKYANSNFPVKTKEPEIPIHKYFNEAKNYLSGVEEQAVKESPRILNPALKLPRIGISENDKPLSKGLKSAVNTGEQLVEGLTTPGTLSQIALSSGESLPAKIIQASFIPGLAKGTEQGVNKTIEGIKNKNPEDIGAGATEALGSGVFAIGLTKGLSKGKVTPEAFEKPLETVADKVVEKQKLQSEVPPVPQEPTVKPIEPVAKPSEQIVSKGEPIKKTYAQSQIGEPFRLTKGQLDNLNYLESEIKSARAGKRIFIESDKGEGNARKVLSDPSTFPISDLGSKESQLRVIEKAKSGIPLTEIESSKFSSMMDYVNQKRGEVVSLRRQTPLKGRIEAKTDFNFGENVKPENQFTTSDVQKLEIPSNERGSIDLTKEEPMSPAKQIAYDIAAKENKARLNVKKDPLKSLKTEFITKINDELYPVQEMFKQAEKKTNLGKVAKPSERFYEQTGRVYNSHSMANQMMQDTGLINAIQAAPDPVILDQVLKSKHAIDLQKNGFETGRNPIADQTILDKYGKEYEPYTNAIVKHSQKMLDYAVDSGLISSDLATGLKKKYPNYVPFNRILESIEGAESPKLELKKAKASLGTQTVVKSMKGSDLPVENSIQNILKKTYETVQQGEINKAAMELVKAQDKLPDLKDIYWEVKPSDTPKLYFDVLDNGVKRRFETNSPELINAVKGLNYKQMSNLMKIVSIPNRIFKSGTTGFRSSFMVTNPVKDLQTAFVNLPYGGKVAVGFLKGVYDVGRKTEKFNELVRNGTLTSSFDVFKDLPEKTIESIRSKRSTLDRLRYNANPKHFFDLLDDIEQKLATPEYATRHSVYYEGEKYYKSKGYSPEDAKIKASIDSRKGTSDFQRRGEWSQAIGALFPYLRASIAGSRSKIHYFSENPTAMSARLTIGVLLPTVITTLWNLSDPKRAKAYLDTKKFEKENNYLLFPNNPTDKDRGRYNAAKLPMAPEYKNESRMVQQVIETLYKKHPLDFKDFAENFVGILSPLTSPRDVVSSLTPTLKSPVEQMANYDIYRDRQIEPSFMQRLPQSKRTYDWTPESINKLAGFVGTSPLRMQKFLYDMGGGLWGQDIPYLVDESLTSTGVFKNKGKVGAKSILQSIKDRFFGASGGQLKEEKRLKKQRDLEKKGTGQ